MSKTLVAAISFLAGILTAISVGKIGKLVLAQSAPRVSDMGRSLQEGDVHNGAVPTDRDRRGIPVVVPLTRFPVNFRETFLRGSKVLDGLDCRGCDFDGTHLIYGGGPFNLESAHFSGLISVEFTGAAANTLNMLKFIDWLQTSSSPIALPEINKTIERKAPVKRKPTDAISFGPSFIGDK
jgi:hypothetical protein